MKSSTRDVELKGIREGLLLALSDAPGGSYKALLAQVETELAGKEDFLQGSRVVLDVGSRRLERSELSRMQSLLAAQELELWAVLAHDEATKAAARGLGLGTRLAGSATDLEGNRLTPEAAEVAVAEDAPQANALLLRETVRSGQTIFHEGHVVIVGDVNPGAEVVATGNVIVWGRLRGLVHAGAEGDDSAIICALELVPTQLRIAGQIAIPPEEQRAYDPMPERASLRDGQIVADPWKERG